MSVSGGVETVSGGYKFHRFESNGNLTVTQSVLVKYLIVAGGGAGGSNLGGNTSSTCGGGGAGGVLSGEVTLAPGTYPITVGAGGVVRANNSGGNGGDSIFNGLTAIGGGGGANRIINGGNGGSGGGRATIGTFAGLGTAGQGSDGSNQSDCLGGGKTSANAGAFAWVDGGLYAAGGGSPACSPSPAGIGGFGSDGVVDGGDGTAATGSGGGGGHTSASGTTAGAGGSGVVVIAVPLSAGGSTVIVIED